MGIREDRLSAELERMQELRKQSTFIDFVTRGQPPEEYVVTFTCGGLIPSDSGPVRADEHVAQIYLSADFPRVPPKVSFLTPSFHPNIAALIQMGGFQARLHEVLAQAPDDETRRRIQEEILADEEVTTARVCLDTLDLNWSLAITLDLICIELAEMIQYKRYNPDDPLNLMAAEWAVRNHDRLPVDNRIILDNKALEGIRILGQSPADTDVEIRID